MLYQLQQRTFILSLHVPESKKTRFVSHQSKGANSRKRAFAERINQLSAAMEDFKMGLGDTEDTESENDQSAEEPAPEE